MVYGCEKIPGGITVAECGYCPHYEAKEKVPAPFESAGSPQAHSPA